MQNTSLPARPDRPLVPSDIPADKCFVRAVAAHVAAGNRPDYDPAAICRQLWPKDLVSLALVTRAASAPATTSTSGWADTLAAKAITSFIGTLQASAASRLIAESLQLNLPGYATITLPRASSTGTPLWVAEGSPAPVGQAVFTGPQLGPPKKMMLIETFTREVAEASAEDLEGIIGTVLQNAMAHSLDVSIFSATVADATRPAGILTGAATTAATGAAGAYAALTDARALIDATVAGGGSGDVRFIASPGRAAALQTYMPSMADKIFGSAHIGAGVLICVDVNGFCSMFPSDPIIRASKEVSLHYEDTSPLQLTTGAQGAGVPASPVRGLFQQDVIALRATLRASWVMRTASVSHIDTGMVW